MVLASFFTLLLGLIAVAVVLLLFGGISATWLLIIPGSPRGSCSASRCARSPRCLNTWVRLPAPAGGRRGRCSNATPVMFPAALLVQHKLGWLLTFNRSTT